MCTWLRRNDGYRGGCFCCSPLLAASRPLFFVTPIALSASGCQKHTMFLASSAWNYTKTNSFGPLSLDNHSPERPGAKQNHIHDTLVGIPRPIKSCTPIALRASVCQKHIMFLASCAWNYTKTNRFEPLSVENYPDGQHAVFPTPKIGKKSMEKSVAAPNKDPNMERSISGFWRPGPLVAPPPHPVPP